MKFKKIFLLTFILILISGCTSATDTQTDTTDTTQNEEVDTENTSTTITFDDTITSSSENVQIEDNQVTITEGGTYELSGSSDDANVIVAAPENESVELILNGLNLTSSTTAPIYFDTASSATITLVENSENTLEDSEVNEELQAPLSFNEMDSYIQGTGTLTLNGNCLEGIQANKDLIIESGTLIIDAIDDGLNAGDSITINGGTHYIIAGGDGIDSNGDLYINGGEIYVSAIYDGGDEASQGAIDHEENSEFIVNGGEIFAFGGTMAVYPDDGSSSIGFGYTIPGDTGLYEIIDSQGNVILSYDLPTAADYFYASSSSFEIGQTYTLNYEGEELQTITVESNFDSDIEDTNGGITIDEDSMQGGPGGETAPGFAP